MKIVVCTGGFDPIHSGHIAYLNEAKKLGDLLFVGVNSDAWLIRKKGKAFMPIEERLAVVGGLKSVDQALTFEDDEKGSATNLLVDLKRQYPYATIIFANGGDRTQANIPEMDVPNIHFAFSVGGDNKANSSSWILQEWKAPKTERQWGYYRVLHEVEGAKVKELTVNPGQSLSNQLHNERAEFWIVTEGQCTVKLEGQAPQQLNKHDSIRISVGDWHLLANPFELPCKLVEVQYGTRCDEDDIRRR